MSEPTPPSTTTLAGPRQVLDRAHELFLAGDLVGFADLFAADGVHELPFAPPGVPVTLTGREAIRQYLSAIKDTPLEMTEFGDLVVRETTDPEVIVTEYEARMRHKTTGAPVRARYIQVVRVHDGEIALWRDYWNPLAGAQALGTLPQLFAALTGESAG